jgi:hypothetical protein
MNNQTGMGGPATEKGGGKHALKANFSMGGNWKITLSSPGKAK